MQHRFRALRIHTSNGTPELRFEDLTLDDIDAGDVVLSAAYAGVGYRDAMAAHGVGRNIRTDRPCVGGVDVSGVVVSSSDARYRAGDHVIVTNYAFGISHDGAFSEIVRVKADWVVPLPSGLSLREAMALGSSGLTAALAFQRLTHGGARPENGPMVVTGSTGGVGSIAVDIFSSQGYEVFAVTRKQDATAYLCNLGAAGVLAGDTILDQGKRLGRPRWAAAVENVGGAMLDRVARTMRPHGRIAICGLAASADVSTTVLPFILRGIDFLGINVGRTLDMSRRLELWRHLANDLKPRHLDQIINLIAFEDLPRILGEMYKGRVQGRVVVKLGEDSLASGSRP